MNVYLCAYAVGFLFGTAGCAVLAPSWNAGAAWHGSVDRAGGVYRAGGSVSGVIDWRACRIARGDSNSRADRGWDRGHRFSTCERVQWMRADLHSGDLLCESGRTTLTSESSTIHGGARALCESSGCGAQQFRVDMDGASAGMLISIPRQRGTGVHFGPSAGLLCLQNVSGRLAAKFGWVLDVRVPRGKRERVDLLELVRRVSRSDRERSDCGSRSDSGGCGAFIDNRISRNSGDNRRNSYSGFIDRGRGAAAVGAASMRHSGEFPRNGARRDSATLGHWGMKQTRPLAGMLALLNSTANSRAPQSEALACS